MLSIEEIAGRLNISKLTVYRWISKGELKSYKLAKKLIRVDEKDFEKFLEERKRR